ncbi:endonuclease domain-containing protein [Streptomyces sp. NPDC048516]|uniref:endonuclease domain-containing protein n=1 Tax=Streptomyces sp. NPDC048516 TaxID=3365565 RepID=UPI003720D974
MTHLTQEERTDYRARQAESAAAWEPYRQRYAALVTGPPICWSWPVDRPGAASEEQAEDRLRAWQDGRCAICGGVERLVTDHDHDTGLVRGLLCRTCNTNEGMNGLPGTVYDRYRERHPTKMLGVQLRYWDPFRKEFAQPAPPRQNTWDAMSGLT